ncbi:MAG TPA: acyltransferase [Candidatus Hydrogenedentes bacterium]|nr:acyltransferase [Candidatus Hydrogenedentota bacterium]
MSLSRVKRLICLALYYGFTRHLPEHSLPRGKLWLLLRRWTAGPTLRHCGKEVHINRGAHFGNGAALSLGDYSSMGFNTRIIGDVTIGSYVGIAQEVFITAYGRQLSRVDMPMALQGKIPDDPVVIEDDVIIFARVIILPGVRVRSGSVIAAGTVVTRDVPPFAVIAGNPARVVKWRKPPRPEWIEGHVTPLAGDHLKPQP